MKKVYILLLFILFFINMQVYGEEKVTIKDIQFDTYSENQNGILYSDSRLLLWNHAYEKTIENVEKFTLNLLYSKGALYLTHDHVLHAGNLEYKNVVDFINVGDSGYAYKDINSNLYVIGTNYSLIDKESSLLARNVDKMFYSMQGTLLYTTYDQVLYAVGKNYFGNKLNDGNDFITPCKILENVKEFGERYALKDNGELYIFHKNYKEGVSFSTPYLREKEVEKVLYENNYGWIWEVIIQMKDGTQKIIYNRTDANSNVESNGKIFHEQIIDVDGKVKQCSGLYFILMDNNKLYYRDENNKKLILIDEDIKEIATFENYSILPLKTSGDLYFYNYYGNYSLAEALLHNGKVKEKTKLLGNVQTVKYAYSPNGSTTNIILLKDESVLRYGSNSHNQFKDMTLVDSYIPVQIDELIHNGKEIKSKQIVLSTVGNKNLMIGHSYDFYASVIPFNAIDKEVEWTSSDESVVSVDNTGYVTAINEGKAKICVTLKSNKNISSCEEVKVNPKITKVEITDGDTRVVYPKIKVVLTANTFPEEALDVPVTWTSDDGVEFFDFYFPNGVQTEVERNQVVAMVPANGNYTVKASVDGVSDTITLTTEDKVNDVNIYINDKLYKEEMDVYLDEGSLQLRLDTLPVGSNIYSLSIECDNYDIITIDSIDRVNQTIHLNYTGKVTITINANNINK